MKKTRVSLSVKMYLFIIAVILAVTVVLLVMSASAYHDTVFVPFSQNLENAEVPADELKPCMNYFLRYLGTEKMRQAREKLGADKEALVRWMDAQPPLRNEALNGIEQTSLTNNVIDTIITLDDFRVSLAADDIWAEIKKDGTVYRITRVTESSEPFLSINDFGSAERYIERPAEDYASPAPHVEGNVHETLRCITFPLDGGSEGRVWIAYNLTDELETHNRFLIRCILAVIILTIAVTVISMFQISRFLIRPVRSLTQAAVNFTPEEDGTYSEAKVSEVTIRNRDEIGDLSREIRSMQEKIVENTGSLARMTAERERISTELDLARNIQASALPGEFPPFPDRTEFDLHASMTPAKEVGGDFYDFFLIDDDHLALVIADVSGKGVPAALFMMVAMSLIRNQLMNGCNPAEALERVNAQLSERNSSMTFVTVWLAVLELSTGKGTACNAGHEFPAFRRSGKTFELLKYKHDTPVGVFPDIPYHLREFEMHPGDCLFVYTDGVPEATGASSEMFGEDRMTETLNRYADSAPEELIRRVHEAVARFTDGAPQFDDITMLCLKYRGSKGTAPS